MLNILKCWLLCRPHGSSPKFRFLYYIIKNNSWEDRSSTNIFFLIYYIQSAYSCCLWGEILFPGSVPIYLCSSQIFVFKRPLYFARFKNVVKNKMFNDILYCKRHGINPNVNVEDVCEVFPDTSEWRKEVFFSKFTFPNEIRVNFSG